MSEREVEVTGPSTCNGEGCVGWAGAEPQAWRTGHAEGYALRWPGYRQEAHRHRAGGAVAQGRGALLGPDRQRAGGARAGAQAAAEGWPRAGGVLRGGAMRLRPAPLAERQAGGELPGGGAVADA